MATTAKGTPYVESADLVSGWPAVSSSLAQHIDDKKQDTYPTQNAQTGTTYTFVLADAAKIVTASNASSSTYTVPPQADVAWLTGTVLRIVNQGAGVVTIAGGSGVTINGTPATLTQYKAAALIRTASNTWTLLPFSSGSAAPTVSGTTGSPSTGTGKAGRTLYTWTGNGSVTFSTTGTIRVLTVGGGRGGGSASLGGGGGYVLDVQEFSVEAGQYDVTIGAGGTYGSNNAGTSSFVRRGAKLEGTAGTSQNTGNAGYSADATGVYSDISGSSVGYGGAGYSTANTATFDSAYGGAPNGGTPRANSGGGGGESGSGAGAAGSVQILV